MNDDGDAGETADHEARDRPHPAARGRVPATGPNWDDKIERHIRAKSPAELADLAWSLTKRFPEVYQEFRERIALQEGDPAQLVAEARRLIQKVTSEVEWRNHGSDEGHTPDYFPIRNRLVRLLESDHYDDVVSLGRELIEGGLRQVSESQYRGKTVAAFSACLPSIFQAVMRSSLSPPERLLFALDAAMADNYDIVGEACGIVLDAPTRPEDWSAVADALTARLRALPAPVREGSGFARDYKRDRLTTRVAGALKRAGRAAELAALYETEARVSGDYQRLVAFLLEQNRVEDAERWAREGIVATHASHLGVASSLATTLCEVAKAREQWDVVAAHAAHHFFEDPTAPGFDELLQAARKAKVEEAVGAAARRFLETGVKPFQVPPPRPAPTPPPKPAGRKKATATRPVPEPVAPARESIAVDPAWPLPLPEYLAPLIEPRGGYDMGPRPRPDVLIDIAIAADRPDEVLHWYDRMRATAARDRSYSNVWVPADRVAAAVAKAHPERALEIYRAALEAQLPHANHTNYENSTAYLRALRPLYAALNRTGEWAALVASIREKYRNRPRFMALLADLEVRKPKT